MSSSSKLWGGDGRFAGGMNSDLVQLNNSLSIDKRLYEEDIRGSLAYSQLLLEVQIIQTDELELIESGFKIIQREWDSGEIKLREDDEDVHSVNERRLTEIIGEVGRKIHTGRSRNDQVAVDMKLWVKKAITEIIVEVKALLNVLVEKADEKVDVIMPGYTHLQRAQPVRFSHWLLSHGFFLQADCDRLKQMLDRVDVMPLGSGAIAGNPFDIDREKLAKILGFKSATKNSMNAVSDRDFVVEFNFVSTLISTHLSRLSEDLILFNSKEFSFIKLSSCFATGSSLMPQKFNPDCLELVRGLTGGIFGQLTNIIVTLKGLPSTYNKDLQMDKQSMFFVFDNIKLSLRVMTGVINTMKVLKSNCWQALSYDMLATDLAYYLVRKGVAFRDAHHSASRVVDFSSKNKIELNKLSLTAMKQIDENISEDVYDIWSFERSVEKYTAVGGTSLQSVKNQIEFLKKYLDA